MSNLLENDNSIINYSKAIELIRNKNYKVWTYNDLYHHKLEFNEKAKTYYDSLIEIGIEKDLALLQTIYHFGSKGSTTRNNCFNIIVLPEKFKNGMENTNYYGKEKPWFNKDKWIVLKMIEIHDWYMNGVGFIEKKVWLEEVMKESEEYDYFYVEFNKYE